MTNKNFRLGLLFAASVLLGACDDQAEITETPLRSVRTMLIHSAANGDQRTFSGIAKSTQEAQLSFKVSGTLYKLPVEVGDELQPGQLIASLDSSQFQLEVQQSEAALAQARASLRNAQANYDRVKRLYENNNASRNDLDTARSTAESAQAQVKASEKAVQLTRLKLSYTRLKSNKACQVADVPVSNNENVSSGQPIVMVTCGDALEIELSVAETYIGGIKRGMQVQTSFSVLPGKRFAGVVTEVGVASTAGGSTFPVTVRLNEQSAQLRSGLAAEVTFEFSADSALQSERILVPPVAVAEDSAGRYVYVLETEPDSKQGIVRRREVTVGQLSAGGLEIVSGLHSGERLVTAGVTVIYDGLPVLVSQ